MKEPNSPEEITPSLTRADAAAILNCGLRTVDRLLAKGQIRAFRVGRSVRIWPADLDAYARRNGYETRQFSTNPRPGSRPPLKLERFAQ